MTFFGRRILPTRGSIIRNMPDATQEAAAALQHLKDGPQVEKADDDGKDDNASVDSQATQILKWNKGDWVNYSFQQEQPMKARVEEECLGDDPVKILFHLDKRVDSVSQEWISATEPPEDAATFESTAPVANTGETSKVVEEMTTQPPPAMPTATNEDDKGAESTSAEKPEKKSEEDQKQAPVNPHELSKQYVYKDQFGSEQGPFDLPDMLSWISMNAFDENTMVKGTDESDFFPMHSHGQFKDAMEAAVKRQEDLKRMVDSIGFAPGMAPAVDLKSEQKRKATAASAPQKKRLKDTPAESMVRMKDNVVRKHFEALTKKVLTVQKMTTYSTKKQASSNPPFYTCLLNIDGINKRPDKLADVDRPRPIPLVTLMLPDTLTAKEAGERFEAIGKALKDPKLQRKKNRDFDLEVYHQDPKAVFFAHHGKKVKKAKTNADATSKKESDDDDDDSED